MPSSLSVRLGSEKKPIAGSDDGFRPIRFLMVRTDQEELVLGLLASLRTWSLQPRRFFEELHEPVYQSSAAPNDVESAFVLMLFQNLAQVSFQFAHESPLKLRQP